MSKIDALAKKKDEELKETKLRSKRYQWYIVIFMGLVGLMDNNLNLMESQVINDIYLHFSVSKDFFAFWQGIFGIITFSVFFIAWFTDAFGRKKGVLVLLLVMGIPAFLIPFISFNIWIFYILYVLLITGTTSNMWEIPVTEESPAKKRGLYGGIATLISLIPVYAIVGGIIARTFGWQWTYGIFFFFMLGLLVLLFFMKEPKRWSDAKEERGHELLKLKKAIKSFNRTDWIYIIISFIVYCAWSVAFKVGAGWAETFFEDPNISPYFPNISWDTIILIAGLMILIGAIVSGILMDKVSRKVTLIVGSIGSVLGFVLLAITKSPIALWIGYLSMPIVFTWIMVYFNEMFRTEIRGTATGIAALGSRLSYVLGPLLASVLLANVESGADPYYILFWIVPGLLMMIPLFTLLIKPYEPKGKTLEIIQEER